jgi:hypothetical protein
VLLVELAQAEDPDGAGRYTVKRWHSEKVEAEDSEGGWRHQRVVLQSLNPAYEPIIIADGEGIKVVGEYVATLDNQEGVS